MKDKKTGSSKRKQFILRMVVIVFISVFLGVSVYTINAKRVLKNQLPMPFGVGVAVVLSGSMEPTLSVDDVIFVRAADSYQVDDIIVFQENQELVIHRIISVDGTSYTTQGDANNTPDPPVELPRVKGRLVMCIPFAGVLVRGLQSLPGIILVLVLAVLLMRLSWRKEKDASRKEQDAIKDEIRRLKGELETNASALEQTETKDTSN